MGILPLLSITWLACLTLVSGHSIQKPLFSPPGEDSGNSAGTNQRKLHGRFLHITDIHPDPFYKLYSSTEEGHACHSGHGPAGVYGAETSDCDSPLALVNATFKWVEENLKDSIDFVIWTGDSARHDNDEDYPRNQEQVEGQNQFLVDKFLDVFGASEDDRHPGPQPDLLVPIVPNFGNNDILPHNIFEKGPNQWTNAYEQIWRPFIPEEQRHGFSRGGWFYVEVIPNKLAVFSLNTMYFFEKNAAVDGCSSHKQPGYEHFEWLRIQLQFLRQRGMKAILAGHVPPARNEEKKMWDETCWQKYALWMRQYRDVIVGSVYGHINIEHFILQDFKDIKSKVADGRSLDDEDESEEETDAHESTNSDNGGFKIAVNVPGYLNALRELWAKLPSAPSSVDLDPGKNLKDESSKLKKYHDRIGGEWAERFSVSLATASVVPNYFSVLRVYEYNITGLEDATPWHADFVQPPPLEWESGIPSDDQDLDIDEDEDSNRNSLDITNSNMSNGQTHPDELRRRTSTEDDNQISTTKKRKKKKKKKKFIVPQPPSSTSPPGPAYSPQPLSWTRYIQYFANNTAINNDLSPKKKALSASPDSQKHTTSTTDHVSHKDNDGPVKPMGWRPGKHVGERPGLDKHHETAPLEFKYESEYDTAAEGDAYGFDKGDGLLMRGWVKLASQIGEFDPSLERFRPDEAAEGDRGGQEQTVKGKKNGKKARKAWYTFVSRAVTGTLNEREIREEFGAE